MTVVSCLCFYIAKKAGYSFHCGDYQIAKVSLPEVRQ